jgi:glycosyltransferase involved in cell wall biosynthesis
VKIVFLNPSGELGGAETALLEMVAAVREARPAWTMEVVASADGPFLARASALGCRSFPLTFPKSLAGLGEWGSRRSVAGRLRFAASVGAAVLPTMRYAARLRDRLKSIAPDIVHSNGLKMHLLGARTSPPSSKLIWHLHDYPESRPVAAALLARHLDRCDAVIANSNSVADQARRLFGSAIPVHACHNAVDLQRFHPEGPRANLDALAGLPSPADDAIRIGLVGTFARWKGHGVFLEALSRLRTRTGSIRAYIIGEPIYETAASQFSRSDLEGLAAASRVADIVGFTGRVDDVPSALRALDIVVHASVEPEPFGLVIAEAMACGRPIVVSRAGGAAEIAEAGALFHTPGDAADLADRLSELAQNPSLRATLGAAGRATALRLFSRTRLADALVPIYESLARSSRS